MRKLQEQRTRGSKEVQELKGDLSGLSVVWVGEESGRGQEKEVGRGQIPRVLAFVRRILDWRTKFGVENLKDI